MIDKAIAPINARLYRIEKDVAAIKNCPTIKKELSQQNKHILNIK